ncbi:MAG: protein translocase subunit SecD [Gammaproteobacteria bacterium]
MNRYPLWKNLLVIAIVLLGLIFAMPSIFGDAPAVQIAPINSATFNKGVLNKATSALEQAKIPYLSTRNESGKGVIVFKDTDEQLRASSVIRGSLNTDDYSVAQNLVPQTPHWMQTLGLKPLAKGLDLVGGIYFRLNVDIKAAINQTLENDLRSIQTDLRQAQVRYKGSSYQNEALQFVFSSPAQRDRAKDTIRKNYPQVTFVDYSVKGDSMLRVTPSPARLQQIRTLAVEQNVAALRRRVNELGVAEPLVQRQGQNSIIVELPGMQNVARAKQQLGDTATVQFRLDYQGTVDPAEVARTGQVPIDAQLFKDQNGNPVLLQRAIIANGPEITDATSGFDQQSGTPDVNVSLNSAAAARMGDVTRHNLNKLMAVLYIQYLTETHKVNGKTITTHKKVERVINNSHIAGVFSNRFQITGLGQDEAKNLALTLRTPLAAPMNIVEERTIGPSLGKQNIHLGFLAVTLGFILVVVGMALYYKAFGLIADAALIMNLVLIVALLSLLQATLTLPGIAGIVLTVGMAVDANVLIYERIREELRVGSSPQAAIQAGYEHAMATIVDANLTTLIAGLVLFAIGTGPIKGFAITLSLGIVTSMFTAIMGTRAIVNAVFGGRRLKSLPV